MARTRTRIRVPVQFDRWVDGLEGFDPGPEVLAEWRDAMERFFSHSQETVHVISNDLRASGRHDTERTGATRVTGTLTYGGTAAVDYAAIEHERGGDHAWLTRAFAMSRRDFERALADGIQTHVRSLT
jgi:hypothetical protein